MDFKFFFSPWHEDDAYTLPAGSVELPASTLDYFARLERIGITLSPDQGTLVVSDYKRFGELARVANIKEE